jgi:hypothetical protein
MNLNGFDFLMSFVVAALLSAAIGGMAGYCCAKLGRYFLEPENHFKENDQCEN